MAIQKFSETWIQGFAEEAARMGVDEEGAKTLLKFAALYESSADPKFQEGFKEAASGVTKEAVPGDIGAGLGKAISGVGRAMFSSPGAATASTLGLTGAGVGGYYGLWRPYVGKGDFERHAQSIRDAVDYGFLNEHQANMAITQLRKKLGDESLAGTGYTARGPGYGTYNWGYGGPY